MLRKALRVALTVGIVAAATLVPASSVSAASPNNFATVNADGTVANGNGVSSVTHTAGTGQYEVTFTSNVSGCAFVATTRHAFSQAIQAFVNSGHLSTSGVFVEIKNQGGGLMDGPFDLALACGQSKWRFAVVGYTANLVRSSPGTTLTHVGAGTYTVNFSSAISRCAFLASVGDPSTGPDVSPAGVYTGSGPTKTQVYVETKNPGGGLQDGIPFQLAVVCPGAASTAEEVVRASGSKARGSTGTSSSRPSNGNYVVTTPLTLTSCTVIGTRGSVNTAVPFTPATVEVTAGPTANSSGIQVRNLLFFGGGLVNQSFHAAAIC